MIGEDRRSRPPLGGLLGPLLEPVYRAVIDARNRRFDAGRGVESFPIPVISVGNLSVGGTGKSPMVAMLVKGLIERGRRPAVVMRGYKASAGHTSDEAREHAALFGDGVPVIANPDRRAAIRDLLARNACDVVVLDDGFQHRRVRRNLDIVLLDATRDPFKDRCLPAGWLREPVGSLARAGVIVLTHCEAARSADVAAMRAACAKAAPRAVVCEAEHAWAAVRVMLAGRPEEASEQPVSTLAGKRLFIACGIGHPEAFARAAEKHGAVIAERWFAPDHHQWSIADARRIAEAASAARADLVLTTGKDWVKLQPLVGGGIPFAVPRLEMRVRTPEGEAELWGRVEGALG